MRKHIDYMLVLPVLKSRGEVLENFRRSLKDKNEIMKKLFPFHLKAGSLKGVIPVPGF